MVLISRWSNKIVGSIVIILGILGIFYLFNSKRLILDQHSFFITRYFKIILVGYGGLVSIFFGVLVFIGFLPPYYKANRYEKAKTNVLGAFFWVPIFVLMIIAISTSFNIIDIKLYIIIGIMFCILVVVVVCTFISSLNTLKEFHKKK